VTCVPIFKNKLKERGYNQSKLLAEFAAKNLNLEFKEVIAKIKDNSMQHGLNFAGRQINVRGVYKICGDVKNKNILLCDDVVTTGATLNECVHILAKENANVFCASAAYTKMGKYSE
jgi:predicted amidophosphoribosyltransferase